MAFLVDVYLDKVKEYSFIHYTLFVTYFLYLIAGAVLHGPAQHAPVTCCLAKVLLLSPL
jgi:hypothetical protein